MAEARIPEKPTPGWLYRLKQLTGRGRSEPRRVTGPQSHSAKSPHNRRKRLLLWGVVLLLAYPVLGTLALWTGLVEWVLRSEDLRVELAKPAYTILPGRIHSKHVRILANGETQFSLEGDNLVINVSVWELVRRQVHVTRLTASDVRYQMRVQVKDERGIEERLQAYPPLHDLPGAKVIREKAAENQEPREGSWTVHVEGLDVTVKELWFFEYRYLGDGRLQGGFLVGPQTMQVSTAVQDIGPGELRFGAERVIARDLRGQITADIPKVNPEEHADASFLELVEARVNMRANVESLAHVSAYLSDMEVTRGKGPLTLDLYLDKGFLGPKSHMDFKTDSVRLKSPGFGLESDWLLDFNATGASGLPLLKSSAKTSYVSVSRGDREFTVQVHGHEEEAALDKIRLSGSTDLKHASVRMPKIVSVDLDDLPVLLPEGAPIRVEGGEARAKLNLEMDQEYWVRGPVHAELDSTRLNVGGLDISGAASLQGHVKMNPKLKTNMVEQVKLGIRQLALAAGDTQVKGWWMDAKSERLILWNGEPPRFEGTVHIRAKSLEPVLEGLAKKDVLSDIIPKLTSLNDFTCKATLRSVGAAQDVTIESESEIWDASGRIYTKGDQKLMALVIGGQAVSVGLADLGSGLEIMPFAKTGWLNERLRSFPKPVVQMAPSKP